MTIQEAYDECKEWYQSDGMWELDGVAFVLALDALKKQIPKEVTCKIDKLFGDISMCCPNCKNTGIVSMSNREIFKHCPECGQALKRS